MREIQLTKGKVTCVDDFDFDWLSQWSWCFDGNYACRMGRKLEGILYQKIIRMHRQILAVTDSLVQVDHIDHTPLNNQRSNLRLCSRAENQSNRSLDRDSSSGYKGVYYHKGNEHSFKPWCARINLDKRVHLGYFSTKEQAALVYNEAALKYFGEFACLNNLS